jgi:hypothetical protein
VQIVVAETTYLIHMIKTYAKVNNALAWSCFTVAFITYFLTLEPSVSFWDCGEFIASAWRLQVVHQPGAPLFLMIERLFAVFAGGELSKVAYWMNMGSALASAGTILFLFWTITALAKKILIKPGQTPTNAELIKIMGAAAVGSLAYAYSDSFWFSAVESEVYALSSLFTAVVFWAILKWEAHADEPRADRWLLFIAYIMGLSIGIHLLNLLTIPAMALVYYYRKTAVPTGSGAFKALLVGILILGLIQYGIIQYLISIAAGFDLFFVNTLSMPFGSGVLFFVVLFLAGIIWAIRNSITYQKKSLNLALLSVVLIIFGYSSFTMIVIRANAGTNLNNYHPADTFSLLGYLNREQYGDRPLLTGPNYNSEPIKYKEGKQLWRKGAGKYEPAGKRGDYEYDQTSTLPRMYSSEPEHVKFYKEWMGFDDAKKPGTMDNIRFLSTYQIGYMYVRYFLWNFVGRQNDDQGQGSGYEGEWLSGIKPLDALHLGNQSHLPPTTLENKAYNRFFFLPLILGLLGAIWHFKRKPQDGAIIALLFFFTGVAIVLYLNQKPYEPRERDYAYTGSFYTFSIWIGLGVLAMSEWLFRRLNASKAAVLATVFGLAAAPVIMAEQGWDDHDRSTKLLPHDMSYNYLQSCAPNAILFTYGDNETFPLWYLQEVEHVRPDIRIVNLSLFDADWYINDMRKKMNSSAALPITMKPSQYVSGERDVLPYVDYKIDGSVELANIVELLLSENELDKVEMQDGSRSNFLPTKNLKLTVNRDEVLKSGTVPAADAARITPAMEWKFNKGMVTKGTLAMFDILVHNKWKRPIYFANTMPKSQFNGLNNYLYREGLTVRLLPLKVEARKEGAPEQANTPVLYSNLMSRFKWGNMKKAKYLDTQSTSDTVILTELFSELTADLIDHGKIVDAGKVADKYQAVIPEKYYGMQSMMGKFFMAKNLYRLGRISKANDTLIKNADFINKELTYLADVSKSKNSLTGGRNVQTGLYFLNEMVQTSKAYKQGKLSGLLQEQLNELERKFSEYSGT